MTALYALLKIWERLTADWDKVSSASRALVGMWEMTVSSVTNVSDCAYSSTALRALVDATRVPFLAMPMAKGVVSDEHVCCVSPARSLALQQADVVICVGTPFDWMLHFGQPPRFDRHVQTVVLDTHAEEFHQNVTTTVALLGTIAVSVTMLTAALTPWTVDRRGDWWRALDDKCTANVATIEAMADDAAVPLNYYAAYKPIRAHIDDNTIVVNEGANTMDIGRSMMNTRHARHRLDAGVFGTMGVGVGFAIAAAFYAKECRPQKQVVCVLGDSAFGFSAMELETVSRYALPITFVIINNGGISKGMDMESWMSIDVGERTTQAPPLALTPACAYERMADALGGRGYLCTTQVDIQRALAQATVNARAGQFSLLNVLISTDADRRPQTHAWLTRSKM